jgi:hypothetical protein
MESAFLKWQESSVWASGAFWEYPYAQLFVKEAIIKNVYILRGHFSFVYQPISNR